jgi:hypothetical protein
LYLPIITLLVMGVDGCQPPRPPEGGVTQRGEVSTRAIDGQYSTYNRKDTNMTTITFELDNITQEQLDNLLDQEELCLNHLVSRELQKLMDDAGNTTDKEPSWDDIPREFEQIGEICIDTGTLVISDPVFIHDASEQAFDDMPNGYTQVKFKDIDKPCAMITSTGFGDGYYPVFAERLQSDKDTIVSIHIPFM